MIDIDNLHKRYRTADGRVSEDYFRIPRFTRCLTGASTWGALCPFWC
ncbi:methionine ABC transporter ATP-binding protein [Klebsiella michiganensis]|nr:methionine ABC transporter ATP-binding protein [Klebsiella michiganensis]STV91014.1 methionine ABC transporter ATP-binding protein [Klebsiella michiganensis]